MTKKVKSTFNENCDKAINQLIKKCGKYPIYKKKYKNMTAEEIYTDLKGK